MGSAKETAEEQLLRMIEGPGAAGSGGSLKVSPLTRLSELLKAMGLGMLRVFLPTPKRGRPDPFLLKLQLLDRLFWVLLLGLGAMVAVELSKQQILPSAETEFVPAQDPAALLEVHLTPEDQLQSLESYRSTLATQNPFRLSRQAAVAAVAPVGQTASNRLQELVSALSVVGISRGAVSEALVEDEDAGRTHFLKVGDEINGLTVISIDEKGITVSYEGEEATLQ